MKVRMYRTEGIAMIVEPVEVYWYQHVWWAVNIRRFLDWFRRGR